MKRKREKGSKKERDKETVVMVVVVVVGSTPRDTRQSAGLFFSFFSFMIACACQKEEEAPPSFTLALGLPDVLKGRRLDVKTAHPFLFRHLQKDKEKDC